MRISDWSSDVCSSDLHRVGHRSDRRDVRRLLVRSDLSAESAHDVLVYPQRARSSPLEAGQPALGLVGPLAELVEGGLGDAGYAGKAVQATVDLAVAEPGEAHEVHGQVGDRKSTRRNSSH